MPLRGGLMHITLRLISSALVWVAVVKAQVSLVSSPNPSVLGQPVTLTATAPSGKVTFYDGVTIVGVGTVSAGQAVLTTSLLPAGVRNLRAFNGVNASGAVTQTVMSN